MQRLALLIGGALASHAISFGALAQEPGAGTPKPPAFHKASPQEKATGKAQRKEDGRAAVKAGSTTGEGEPQPPRQVKVPRDDRQQARAQRKAETARAARAGEIQAAGEVGPTK